MAASDHQQERATKRNAPRTEEAARGVQSWIIAVLAGGLVLCVYVWYVSIGTWTSWPSGTDYYDQLASAFIGGHPWLAAIPDPALLALQDPYDPAQRENIPHLSDASLYEGRYFLYFGPMPAVLVMAARLVHPGPIRDIQIAFALTYGTFLALALLILETWKHRFPHIPAWIVGVLLAAIGLMGPAPWNLGNRAWVHSAAISAGTFFFMAGLVTIMGVSDRNSRYFFRACLAGVLWGCAISSRSLHPGTDRACGDHYRDCAIWTSGVLRAGPKSPAGRLRACATAPGNPRGSGLVQLRAFRQAPGIRHPLCPGVPKLA